MLHTNSPFMAIQPAPMSSVRYFEIKARRQAAAFVSLSEDSGSIRPRRSTSGHHSDLRTEGRFPDSGRRLPACARASTSAACHRSPTGDGGFGFGGDAAGSLGLPSSVLSTNHWPRSRGDDHRLEIVAIFWCALARFKEFEAECDVGPGAISDFLEQYAGIHLPRLCGAAVSAAFVMPGVIDPELADGASG